MPSVFCSLLIPMGHGIKKIKICNVLYKLMLSYRFNLLSVLFFIS